MNLVYSPSTPWILMVLGILIGGYGISTMASIFYGIFVLQSRLIFAQINNETVTKMTWGISFFDRCIASLCPLIGIALIILGIKLLHAI